MSVPEVKIEILAPLTEEIDGPQADPDWIENMWTQLRIKQPVIAGYLNTIKDESAVVVGMIVYRMLDSQINANELEELLS